MIGLSLITALSFLVVSESAQFTSAVTFSEAINLALNTPQPQVSLSLGDYNGDGRRDFGIAFANSTSQVRGNPSVGQPGPRFARIEKSPLRVEPGGDDIVLADVDRDGIDDWCRVEYSQKKLVVTPGGVFAGSSRDLPRNPLALHIADLDGDGKLDYLVGYTSSPASVLRGSDDGSSGPPANVQVAGPALVIADLDGDGAQDILSGGGSSPRVSVSRGTGALTFAAPEVVADLPGGGISYIEGLAARSLRGGERPTIAAVVRDTSAGRRSLYILRPNAAIGAPVYETSGLLHATFADMNRDSLQDLVIVDTDSQRVVIHGGTFAGTWPEIAAIDIAPHVVGAAVAGDVSGDQVPDVVLASRSGQAIIVYVNDTPPPRRRSARP